ncbi:hypothetical protein V1525DRAFT_117906 [Lipomyces kononenkoae]|uniref:Uncharacterized protein n=1 Tax=Lipomyces kononenkoae TaxID=34357 RepID=A0ACC3T5Y8_LIPKO
MERTEHYSSRRFDVGLLIGDPFALATISVATIGWFIALAASIASDVEGPYPQFSWWGIAYQFLVICGVVYVMAANAIEAYGVAIVGFTAAALVYTTNSTNNLVYTGRAADGAAAAGNILLSIINVLWIFYFGTTPDAAPHAFVDSYALHRQAQYNNDQPTRKYPGGGPQPSPAHSRAFPPMQQAAMATSRSQSQSQQGFYENGPPTGSTRPHQQQMFTSAQLNGFETTSSQNGGGGPGSMVTRRPSAPAQGYTLSLHNGSGLVLPPTGSVTNLNSGHGTMLNGAQDELQQSQQQQQQQQTGDRSTMMEPLDMPTEYPLRARAIYSYDANPEDANEISFVKGEILEVSDVSGRWWQARRANGEVGICPSNYVQLLDT